MKMSNQKIQFVAACLLVLLVSLPSSANVLITAFTEGAADSSQIPYGYMGYMFNMNAGESVIVTELGRYFYNGEHYPAGGANTGIHEVILVRRENDQLKVIAETRVDMTQPYDNETTVTFSAPITYAAGFVYGTLATPIMISAADAQYGQYGILSREVSHTGPWEFFRGMAASPLPSLNSEFTADSVSTGGMIATGSSTDLNVGDVIAWPGGAPWMLAVNMRYTAVPEPATMALLVGGIGLALRKRKI